MVDAPCTLLTVYAVTLPTEVPLTVTSAIWKPLSAVMVKVTLSPTLAVTVPLGLIEPPLPAEAVMLTVAGVVGVVGSVGAVGEDGSVGDDGEEG